MISGDNFYFIHNPKSAGTSIRKRLSEYATLSHQYDGEYQIYSTQLDRVVEWFHLTASDAKTVLPSNDNQFRFGFVRNPYDRFFSAVSEHQYQHGIRIDDINEFIGSLDRSALRYDWRFIHLCPQHYFFYDGIRCVADFIGRHERLDIDWEFIQKTIGIQVKPLGHFKTTSRYQNCCEYNMTDLLQHSLRKLDYLYSKDFDLFGYESMTERSAPDDHTHRIEAIAGVPHSITLETSNMTLGEQCAYWRAKAKHEIKTIG